MWNCVMLSCLVRQHICELPHLSIIQCLYIQILFLFISHLNWRGWWQYLREQKTRSSQKTVLPVDADRTMVVMAHKLAPPHIIETLPDCTLTPLGREPATTHLTPTPTDSNPLLVDKAPCPPQSTPTRAVCKATAVPKARRPPQLTQTPRLKQESNCSQVRFRSYGPYYFAVASLYLFIPTTFEIEGSNWNSNGATGMF